MKQKTNKDADLEQIKSDLGEYPTVLICAFEGLKVEEDFQLRNQVREAGGRYRVIQNRLARLASKDTPFEESLGDLRGMTSLACAGEDPLSLVKTLVAYAKEHPSFQFKSGVVEGRVLDADALNQLATLPGKEAIYAKLLFLINAPARQLVSVINAPARDLAIVIDQGVKEEKFRAQP
jgi:large subunit ribosomal protein L10